MSDLMLYGVLDMPYEMAMSSEISRRQFYGRAQEAVQRLKAAEAKLEELGAAPAQPKAQIGASIDSPEFRKLLIAYTEANGPKGNDWDWQVARSALINHIDAWVGSPARDATPAGWKPVPIEPTESMITRGFESWPDRHFSKPEDWAAYEAMSGCQQAARRARLCWGAMVADAPAPGSEAGNDQGVAQ